MFDTRRKFLSLMAAAGVLIAARAGNLVAQARPSTDRPQIPDSSPDADQPAPLPGKSPTKMMLEENQKDIKKNIEKLYKLATYLKSEVEKTDSSQVLSLTLVKKAEEIEKLARDIKTRAKG